MKKWLLVVLFVIAGMSLSNEAKADDPRISRIISALEVITDRLDRMERSGNYGGGYSQSSYTQPVANWQQPYGQQQYCPSCQRPMSGGNPLQLRNVSGYQGFGGGRQVVYVLYE